MAGQQDTIGEPGVMGNDPAHLKYPQGVTVDGDGNLYVADTDNHLIRKVTPQRVMTTIFDGAAAGLNSPVGIMVSPGARLYICDTGSDSIWEMSTSGIGQKIAGSTSGYLDGIGTAARFNKPYHLVWCDTDRGEALFIADQKNQRLRKLMLGSYSVTTVAGSMVGYDEGDCTIAKFNWPRGVAALNDGIVYIIDTSNHRIRKAQ